jgi:hypothetical protein
LPIKLTLGKIKDKTIKNWSNNHLNQLNSLQKCTSMTEFNKQLIDYNRRKETTTEEVLAKICELCNHDWEKDFKSNFVI